MRRVAIVMIALFGALAAFLFALLASPAAKRLVSELAERRLAEAIGHEVEIGAVTGDLFRRFHLVGLRFKNGGTVWAEISRVEIEWMPRRLLDGDLEIAKIAVSDAKVLALPPQSGEQKPFKGFELPQKLPNLTISEIVIKNLVVDQSVTGDPVRLDGDGSITMGGRALSINAALYAEDARDDLKVKILRQPDTGRLVVDTRVASNPDGAISTLANANGATDFFAKGDGTPEDFLLRFNGALGDAGSIAGEARTNLEAIDTLQVVLTARPGARFAQIREDIGDVISVDAVFRPIERGGALELRSVSAKNGALSGSIDWRNSKNALETARADLSILLTNDWRPEIQAAIGNRADLSASLLQRGRAYSIDAIASAPEISLKFTDAVTDLQTRIEGKTEVKISAGSSLAAPLGSELHAKADIDFDRNNAVAIKNLTLLGSDGEQLTGDFRYAIAAPQFFAKGAFSFSESSIGKLLPSLRTRGKLAGDFSAEGLPGDFRIQLTATAPAIAHNSATLGPMRAAISVAGLPSSPSGVMSVRAIDGSRRLSADIQRDAKDMWGLNKIDYRAPGFTMRGAIGFNPATEELSIDLDYSGADRAEPWPGLVMEGNGRAFGALVRSRADNRLAIDIASIRTKSLFVENAKLAASGSYEELSFVASAAAIGAADRLEIDKVSLSGAIDIDRGPVITVSAASANLNGMPLTLVAPASAALGDGLTVRDLKVRAGPDGAAHLDGSFASSRWQAKARISGVNLPGSVSTAKFSLDLDTDRRPLATGDFQVRSEISSGEAIVLPGNFLWDGKSLKVFADADNGAFYADLSLPLQLRRTDPLSLDLDGALAGTARYRGRAEAIAIFMPAALQSIEGDLDFSGSVSGSLKTPRIAGNLELRNGAYTELASGFSVVGVDLAAVADGTIEATVIKLSATASGAGQPRKSISAVGSLDLRDDFRLSTTVTLDRAEFSGGPISNVNASGAVTVAGKLDDLIVGGDIEIHALEAELFTPADIGLVDIDVIAVNGDGAPLSERAAARRKGSLRYEIRLSGDDRIMVRGRGLNSTWRANAQIAGGGDRPLVLGVMNLKRGDLEFAGRRFNLSRGSIGFDTFAPNDPTIDIRAERVTRDGVTVAVVISGRSSALRVALESTPSLANEEIMALILFDKSPDQLSAFESLQVADALTQLGGIGVFGGKGVAGAARDALGLDLLNLEIDEADSSSSLLTVGKYVTDGLFVSASQNARGENGSLRIEYEIGSSFSVETELRQDGDQTISANWKKDF